MRSPKTVSALESLGRGRLSDNFFLRDFLHSEIAEISGIPNIPDDPDLAISAGSHLCVELLEPLQEVFGRLAIRSAYRCSAVNDYGNRHGFNCARNKKNFAGHIWDRLDESGLMGATACVVVPRLVDFAASGGGWQAMAWWVHDHLPYSNLQFFPQLMAFNIRWHESPRRVISSYVAPKGVLTRPGFANFNGKHDSEYCRLLDFAGNVTAATTT